MEASRYETDYSLVFRKVTAKGYSLVLRGFRRREKGESGRKKVVVLEEGAFSLGEYSLLY